LLSEEVQVRLFVVERPRYVNLDLETELPYWVVSHVLEGSVATSTGDYHAQAKSGSVMVHPPRVRFTERAESPGVHEYFGFEAWTSPHRDLMRLVPVDLVVALPDPHAWSREFSRLLRASRREGSRARAECLFRSLSLLYQVFDAWEAAGSVPRPDGIETPSDRFEVVLRHMERNLDRRISREELAGLVHLHPGYFDRAFRQRFGQLPAAMLRQMRVRRAQHLLGTTDDTLDAIATACGFTDAANLSRSFRSQVGTSPGRYREGAKTTTQGYVPILGKDEGSG
jgi:AraC-like DNA-binding protein